MTGNELAKTCANFVNGYNDEKEFAKAMSQQHRTLQQSFTRMIIEYFKLQAQETDDGRNQASIELSKKIIKLINDEDIVLPFI